VKNTNTSQKSHITNADCSTGLSSSVGSPAIKPAYKTITNLAKYIYIAFGVVFFGLGVLGAVLPIIPTTPFIVVAAICFAKSSRKLHEWCINTKFYKDNAESFVERRAMTVKTKVILISTVTVVMGLSFIALVIFSAPVVAKVILFVVWLLHVLYFGFKVKTEK